MTESSRDQQMRALLRAYLLLTKRSLIDTTDQGLLRDLLFELQDAEIRKRKKGGNPDRQSTRFRRGVLMACVRYLRSPVGGAPSDSAALAALAGRIDVPVKRLKADYDHGAHSSAPQGHLDPRRIRDLASRHEAESVLELLAHLYRTSTRRGAGKGRKNIAAA